MLAFCWVSIFASLTSLSLLLIHLRNLRATTLLAPAMWLAICILFTFVLSLGSVYAAWDLSRLLLFLAGNSTFCPQMGLFGAKRPQDRGWQVIVATLWMVLSIPVLQSLAFSSDGFFEIHGMWKIFTWVLIVFGFLNHFLTKFVGAAFFMMVGQVSIFAPFLLRAESPPKIWLSVFQVALLLGLISAKLAASKKRPSDIHPLDKVWRDFRDLFGMVWSLRIMERVNQLAKQEKWTVQLTWSGFTPASELGDSQIADDVEKCLRTLLRRFVDSEWIDARLQPTGESTDSRSQ